MLRYALPKLAISSVLLLGSSMLWAETPPGKCQGGPPPSVRPPGPMGLLMHPDPPDGDFFGAGGIPPFLLGLDLSEAEQDKVFEVVHAAAPGLRTQWKAVRKARASLREVAQGAQFDAARANTLTQAVGEAQRQIELLQVRMDHDIFSILTSEQQSKVLARERDLDQRTPPAWRKPNDLCGPEALHRADK